MLLATETRADLVSIFRKNPGLIDSAEGIARRVGRNGGAIQADLQELVKLGILKTRRFGDNEVISLDRARDKTIQNEVGEYLQNLKPNIKG